MHFPSSRQRKAIKMRASNYVSRYVSTCTHTYVRNNKDVDFSVADVNLFTAALGKWHCLLTLLRSHSTHTHTRP